MNLSETKTQTHKIKAVILTRSFNFVHNNGGRKISRRKKCKVSVFNTSTKEFFISRKVIGFPLKVRQESFVGVGQNQNFSQTNSGAITPKTIEAVNQIKAIQWPKFGDKTKKRIFRLSLHTAAIAAVLVLALTGKISASNQTLSNITPESTKNQTSIIATGAILASSTQSLISADISQRARDLTNASILATSGDAFLAKKSPVLTAGAPVRGITSYRVKEGDTLSSLSAKFNITTDTIKWANNIEDENQIQPGKDLIILPISGILHTVVEGDNLSTLAQTYQSNASLIESYNQLEGHPPAIGSQLIIPDGVKTLPAQVATRITSAQSAGTNNVFTISGFSGPGNLGNTYSYGYCTWYVASRRPIPSNWGNAYSWLYMAQRSGYATGTVPRVGAVAWGPGNHVAYVESVNGDGTVTVSEMNYWGGGGGWGRRSYRTTSASTFKYIY